VEGAAVQETALVALSVKRGALWASLPDSVPLYRTSLVQDFDGLNSGHGLTRTKPSSKVVSTFIRSIGPELLLDIVGLSTIVKVGQKL